MYGQREERKKITFLLDLGLVVVKKICCTSGVHSTQLLQYAAARHLLVSLCLLEEGMSVQLLPEG